MPVVVLACADFDDIPHVLFHRVRYDSVLLIVGVLNGTAAVSLGDGALHGARHRIGVQDDHAVLIARRPSDGLDERPLGAQEAFLVRVQHCYQRHLRNIQSLTQQVDADQHVKHAEPQIADNLHALNGFDVEMDVAHPDTGTFQIVGQILRHFLGQRGDEHPFAPRNAHLNLAQQIVYLSLDGTHRNQRVKQSGRTYDLFYGALGMLCLVVARRGADKHSLPHALLEFLKVQRSVVVGGWQAEAVLHQIPLACGVAAAHTAHLRNGNVRFVDKEQVVIREIVQQSIGGGTRLAAGQYAGIILYAGAETDLPQHLQIVPHPFLNTLCLDELVLRFEKGNTLPHFLLNLGKCRLPLLA